MQFGITLSNPSYQDTPVYFTTVTGTAGSADYTHTDGSVIIPAHQTGPVYAEVQTTDDAISECDEAFYIDASKDSNIYYQNYGTGEGPIVDNDFPSVSVGDAQVIEGGTLRFEVSLSAAPLMVATINYSTSDGTACSDDYTGTTGTLSIAAGQAGPIYLDVTTTDDTLVECAEGMTLNLSNPSRLTIDDGTGQGVICDNDMPLVLETSIDATVSAPLLSANQLTIVAQDAIAIWRATGVPTENLLAVDFRIADLPSNTLGIASPGVVTIDIDGAGYGWFTELSSRPVGQHADLLTTVLHELGHELGYEDAYAPGYTGLMAGSLPLDTRRLPDLQAASISATDRLFADAAPGVAGWRTWDSASDDNDLFLFLPLRR